ncbi:MAG: hypothetical protein KAJ03_12430 [Gammaproteobacteria bacterium]|nr:hypothetical protein [Gammaproteobacteria bacterium]
MATVDLTTGGSTGAASNLSGRIFTHYKELNFATTNRGAADVLQLFDIPINSHVLSVSWEVVTIEDSTATFDLGDGVDPNGFVAAADAEVLAAGASTVTTAYSVAVGGGRFYSAADTIDMVLSAAMDTGKIRVWAVVLDFGV